VSILVQEADDTLITVKVGQNTVEQLVPPWIQHRVRGETVAPDEDRKEREEFYQRVLDSIERGLGHERDLSNYMSEGRLSAPQGGAGA
jgi:hypothetical protein